AALRRNGPAPRLEGAGGAGPFGGRRTGRPAGRPTPVRAARRARQGHAPASGALTPTGRPPRHPNNVGSVDSQAAASSGNPIAAPPSITSSADRSSTAPSSAQPISCAAHSSISRVTLAPGTATSALAADSENNATNGSGEDGNTTRAPTPLIRQASTSACASP